MVSLANEVRSFHVEKKEDVSSFGKPPAVGGLSQEPSLYDLLSYSYCYIGIMTGTSEKVMTSSCWGILCSYGVLLLLLLFYLLLHES